MATQMYTQGLADILNGVVALAPAGSTKVMLVDDTYTPLKTELVVAGTVASAEISVGGYVGGFGGAGRLDADVTAVVDQANNRVELTFQNLTWAGLSAGVTIGGAVWFAPGTIDDTDARLLAFLDANDVATDGNDYQLSFNPTDGNIRFNV